MSIYRPEFEAALKLLARISEAMAARGLPRPTLVGGGAVENSECKPDYIEFSAIFC
ncbi:MAG: hypothetical protein ACK5HY_17035 [Parahaliea sp.]